MQVCPTCGSGNLVKNGSIHNKKPKSMCKDSGRQFTKNRKKEEISEEKKNIVDRLLLEKISLSGISRVLWISESWLQDYVNDKYAQASQTL